jgi:uncharacterized repeat protein (TIGR03803 family)
VKNTMQSWDRISEIRLRAVLGAITLAVVVAVISIPSQAQTYKVLHRFKGSPDGAVPASLLAQDAKGNLYGTTPLGGKSGCWNDYGCGVVFRLDTAGKETLLHSFTGGSDGANPWTGASLFLDAAGNLYGTTYLGGIGSCMDGNQTGCGVIFEVSKIGKYRVLYRFTGGADGGLPISGLARDAAGNLYGSTINGGVNKFPDGFGTVFKVDPTGHLTVLYTFTSASDVQYASTLRLDKAGNLYGTSQRGGTHGLGTVFEVDTTGKETVLHSFAGNPDGLGPFGGLLTDPDGDFYGTTEEGGNAACNKVRTCGTVFKLDTSGKETVLWNFGTTDDGKWPLSTLALDTKGNLYGTTSSAGAYGRGTVFQFDTSGQEKVLYDFPSRSDGANPYQGVIRDSKGNLYGMTQHGGIASSCPVFDGCGVVFEITP